jgi:hypothetical protein
MCSRDTKNPTGGVNRGHVMESLDPDDDLQLFKELGVIVHYPTMVRYAL